MTDHPALLKQIFTEARPYVEQLVELNVVFTGFRKLATENGLDWGQIKALLRAEIEDGAAGGSEKVDKIIQKAEFAGEYAALLGLGSANMNECNSISEPAPDRAARRKQRLSESMDDTKALSAEAAALGLISEDAHAETVRIADSVARKFGAGVINPPEPDPPHDPTTGEITDPASPPEAEQEGASTPPRRRPEGAPSINSDVTAPVTGDAGETQSPLPRKRPPGARPVTEALVDASPIPPDDGLSIPEFLRRTKAA